jgi:hypothetical protein
LCRPSLEAAMLKVGADVWILTEANQATFVPDYNAITTKPVSGYHVDEEVSTALRTRWPISLSLPTRDPQCAVCAELAPPIGPRCLSEGLAARVRKVRMREGVVAGVKAIDHNGVDVEIDA